MTDREEVQTAALFMDTIKPDWFENINLDTFDMIDQQQCVCGQNGLDWNDVQEKFDDAVKDEASFIFATNTYEWKDEILLRLRVRGIEPATTVVYTVTVKQSRMTAGSVEALLNQVPGLVSFETKEAL